MSSDRWARNHRAHILFPTRIRARRSELPLTLHQKRNQEVRGLEIAPTAQRRNARRRQRGTKGSGALPPATVRATERTATTQERSAAVCSGRGRPNAPTPRGEPAVSASGGPCGPPGATEGSGTGGRNPQSGCSATPTGRFAAVEALAAARWAERGAGALHGGRLDVTPLMRGNAGDGGLDARRVRARSFAPTLSARPDRTPPDGVSEAHRRRGRRRRDSGSALARRVPLGSWRAPQLGARRESRPCVFGLVGAGVVF